MSVAVNTPSPFLPITSLQLQHLQAVTHSFAQRRPVISPVFNNFRTLSVATGGGTRFGLGTFRGVSFVPCLPARDCTKVSGGKTTPNTKSSDGCRPHSMLYFAI